MLLLLLGRWQDALFGLAALANTVIGCVQELRARRMLERLALLHDVQVTVLRQSGPAEIAVRDVLPEDLLLLRPGEQLPADACVLTAAGLEVDESLLTGESDPVPKTAGDRLLSGSSVIAGTGRARVERIGADSFAGRIGAQAKRFSLINSELRNGLNRILRTLSWALLPIMALVVNGQIQSEHGWSEAIRNGTWRDAAVAAVASVISMIPQGLVLMTSVAFAVGALKLARRQVLVQELPAVEALARVDILCLDKTGTLTEGAAVFEAAYRPDGQVLGGYGSQDGRAVAGADGSGGRALARWELALSWFAADVNANATSRCLRSVFKDAPTASPLSTVVFASSRKWSAVSFAAGPASGAWVLGAPEFVLNRAAGGAPDPSVAPVLAVAAELALSGRRVLVLAHAPTAMTGPEAEQYMLPPGLLPVVVLTFREQIRPDAARTLAYFKDEGIGVRIISGDSPGTVSAVAREVGLVFEGDGVDARTLPSDPDQLGEILEGHLVFGRVTPGQKKDMVQALQRRGHVVAMTGDGVNDALSLKEADLGIAMGSGAAATRTVSRLVLLDNKFSRLPAVMAEGRRVIANVERVSMLFLTKTAYAVLLSLAYAGLFWPFPFLPRQLSAVDGLTIGIPAFFLALMPNTRRYVPGFLKRSLVFAIPAGSVAAVVVLAVNAYALFGTAYPLPTVRNATVLALSVVGLWVLLVLARPLDRWRRLLVASMYLGLGGLLALPLVRDFFALAVPPPDLLAVSLLAASAGCAGIEAIHRHLHKD